MHIPPYFFFHIPIFYQCLPLVPLNETGIQTMYTVQFTEASLPGTKGQERSRADKLRITNKATALAFHYYNKYPRKINLCRNRLFLSSDLEGSVHYELAILLWSYGKEAQISHYTGAKKQKRGNQYPIQGHASNYSYWKIFC